MLLSSPLEWFPLRVRTVFCTAHIQMNTVYHVLGYTLVPFFLILQAIGLEDSRNHIQAKQWRRETHAFSFTLRSGRSQIRKIRETGKCLKLTRAIQLDGTVHQHSPPASPRCFSKSSERTIYFSLPEQKHLPQYTFRLDITTLPQVTRVPWHLLLPGFHNFRPSRNSQDALQLGTESAGSSLTR